MGDERTTLAFQRENQKADKKNEGKAYSACVVAPSLTTHRGPKIRVDYQFRRHWQKIGTKEPVRQRVWNPIGAYLRPTRKTCLEGGHMFLTQWGRPKGKSQGLSSVTASVRCRDQAPGRSSERPPPSNYIAGKTRTYARARNPYLAPSSRKAG